MAFDGSHKDEWELPEKRVSLRIKKAAGTESVRRRESHRQLAVFLKSIKMTSRLLLLPFDQRPGPPHIVFDIGPGKSLGIR